MDRFRSFDIYIHTRTRGIQYLSWILLSARTDLNPFTSTFTQGHKGCNDQIRFYSVSGRMSVTVVRTDLDLSASTVTQGCEVDDD